MKRDSQPVASFLFAVLGVLTLGPLVPTNFAYAAGDASKAEVEYICGTDPRSPAYAMSGSMQCPDGSRKELAHDSKETFCFYNANCTPVTARVKRMVEEEAKKEWRSMADDELNQTLIKLMANPEKAPKLAPQIEFSPTGVQCVAARSKNGNPDCPRVNECVNQPASALFWKIVPMKADLQPSMSDSQGFRIEKSEKGAPQRTAPRGTIQ